MLSKLKDVFNTPEGWAVALALVWSVGIDKFHWPPSLFDSMLGGHGLTPAALWIFGGVLVLAKIRGGDTLSGKSVPFQPIVTGSGAKTMALAGAVLISLLTLHSVALADDGAQLDSLPAASIHRLSGGVLLGAVSHEGTPATTQAGFAKGGFSYNLGLLSFVLYAQGTFAEDSRYQAMGGARGVLAQLGAGGETQLAVRADYGHLWGKGYGAVARKREQEGAAWKDNTLKLGVDISHVVLKSRSGRGILGIQVATEYMPDNGEIDVPLALAWQGFGGKR